jgi:large subunit ribosomal protein L7/L12
MSLMEVVELISRHGREVRRHRRCSGCDGRCRPAAAAAAPVEEQTEFTVVLKEPATRRSSHQGRARLTGLGLKEAKDLVEAVPASSRTPSKADADKIKKKLEEAGAKVEIK